MGRKRVDGTDDTEEQEVAFADEGAPVAELDVLVTDDVVLPVFFTDVVDALAPVVPATAVRFTGASVVAWLRNANLRRRNVYRDVILLDTDGLPDKQVRFALFLLSKAVKDGGSLYVPASLPTVVYPEGWGLPNVVGDYACLRRLYA